MPAVCSLGFSVSASAFHAVRTGLVRRRPEQVAVHVPRAYIHSGFRRVVRPARVAGSVQGVQGAAFGRQPAVGKRVSGRQGAVRAARRRPVFFAKLEVDMAEVRNIRMQGRSEAFLQKVRSGRREHEVEADGQGPEDVYRLSVYKEGSRH